jgi:predicted RNase H-like HicB family nuclease
MIAVHPDTAGEEPVGEQQIHPSWRVPIDVTVWLIPEDGRWTALVQEFDIAGVGPTEEAALREMDELVRDYLQLLLREGASQKQARRPISRQRRVRLEARRMVASVRRRMSREPVVHRVPHQAPC